jgi:hypothetical protein
MLQLGAFLAMILMVFTISVLRFVWFMMFGNKVPKVIEDINKEKTE